jgi:hypothetical protein
MEERTMESEIVILPATAIPEPEARPVPIPEPTAYVPEEITVTDEFEIAISPTIDDPTTEEPDPSPEPT